MAKIRATERAMEKYNETSNGSRKELNSFFKNVDNDKINNKKLIKLKISNHDVFYSRKCKNVYAVITQKKKIWYLVDILTKSELKDIA